jgi:dienelactone hydrolase
MLAKLGYDSFAVDLFGKGNRPADMAAKKAATQALYDDRETFRARILGGLAAARPQTSTSAVVMGYCFGGAAVLELARSEKAEDVKGYVSFHGGLTTPPGQSYPANTPPILIAHGGADTSVKMEDVAKLSAELEAAHAPYEIEVYSGAPHAFTVFGSDRYQKRADELSWAAFTRFLGEQLGS